MSNLLPSIFALSLAALAALYLALHRLASGTQQAQRDLAAQALLIATAIQAVHFTEEAITGFHERLPNLFGLEPLPFGGFVAFNVLWLMLWAVSVRGIRSGRRDAFFTAWFLAIAGMINGIAHPLLSIAEGDYFPGLLSSPVIAIACIVLWRRLISATTKDQFL